MSPACIGAEKPGIHPFGIELRCAVCTMLGVVEKYEGDVMKRMAGHERAHTWIIDYSAARARAIAWLGDRYLLARPINASESTWRNRHPLPAPAGSGESSP
jgi:hypothetical protein